MLFLTIGWQNGGEYMATSREEFVAGLKNPDDDVRLGILVAAETGARNGSHEAVYALVFALGDANDLIAEMAKEVLHALVSTHVANTFTLSNIKSNIENSTEIEAAGKARMDKLLGEVTGLATVGILDWRTAMKIELGTGRNGKAPQPVQKQRGA